MAETLEDITEAASTILLVSVNVAIVLCCSKLDLGKNTSVFPSQAFEMDPCPLTVATHLSHGINQQC